MSFADAAVWPAVPTYLASLAMAGLAVLLWVRGRNVAARAFGAYLLFWGGTIAASAAFNVMPASPEALVAVRLSRIYALAALPALVILAGTYPHPRGVFARRGVILAIALAGAAATLAVLLWPGLEATPAIVERDGALIVRNVALGPLTPFVNLAIGGTGLLAWHFAGLLRAAPPTEERSRFLLALAFTIYPLWRLIRVPRSRLWPTDDFVRTRALLSPADRAFDLALELVYVVCLLFALWAAVRILRDRHARGRPVAGLAALLATMTALGSTYGILVPTNLRMIDFGFATLFLPLVATYALLRGDLLGLDGRVRIALSKSTIAAVFIAVFFIASEAAQQFFGDTLQSTYLGIAAAGALVFAMAPLQRAAERLAERAVPTPPIPSGQGVETYRRAVRLALRDRVLSSDEEVELATVAHDLGLTAPEAMRIRLEVEREVRGEDA